MIHFDFINVKKYLNWIIILFFLIHGSLFFFNPLELYNPDNPLKKLKLYLLIFFFILNFDQIKSKDVIYFVSISCFFLFLIRVSHSFDLFTLKDVVVKFFYYLLPFSIFLISSVIDKVNIDSIIKIVALITILFGVVEFFILGNYFIIFGAEYIRIISIFLNPNNLGLSCFLMVIYFHENNGGKVKYLFILALIFIVYLSGSKASLILIFLFFFIEIFIFVFSILQKRFISSFGILIFFLFCSIIVAGIFIVYYLSGFDFLFNLKTRDFDFFSENSTGQIRFNQLLNYLEKISLNPLAPDYNFLLNTYDITWIYFYSDFGLIGFLFFLLIFFIFLVSVRKVWSYKQFVILSLFFMASFSESILTIWPFSYVLWYFVFSKRVCIALNRNKNLELV